MPKDQLITTAKEIIQNVDTLHRCGRCKRESERRTFHDSIIRRGKSFVAVKQDDKFWFAPSKFVGYVANNEKHLDKRELRGGGETNTAINSVLGPQANIGSRTYKSTEKAYLTYCQDHDIEPSNNKRNYWLIDAEDDKIAADLLEKETIASYKKQAKRQTRTVPVGALKPRVALSTSIKYARDPEIRAYALLHSKGFCEACDCEAPFKTHDGIPFLEVHHIRHLADGGSDIISNVAALCPNCHRKLHHSGDSEKKRLKYALLKKVARLKNQ